MRSTVAVLALVAVVLSGTDAFFLSDLVNGVKDFANGVADKVGDAWNWSGGNCIILTADKYINCVPNVGISSRAEPSNQGLITALNKACPRFDVGTDAKLTDVVRAAFAKADENHDGELDKSESANFEKLVDVLNYCAELRKKKKAGH